jgi:hypothetical protein
MNETNINVVDVLFTVLVYGPPILVILLVIYVLRKKKMK